LFLKVIVKLTHVLIPAQPIAVQVSKSHAKRSQSPVWKSVTFTLNSMCGAEKKKKSRSPRKTWQGKGFANSTLNLYIMGNSTSKNTDYSTLSSSRVEDTVLCEYVDLAAQSMGSTILRASDEFFGAAANILKPDAVKHNDDEDTGN
jgi:hypothetical protein